MNEEAIIEVTLEEELEPNSDVSHAYVICNMCSSKVVVGIILETACGVLLRFHNHCSSVNCSECKEIKQITPDPNMLPCTLCGHSRQI